MIVDFQHHFTPRELFREDLGDRRVLQYDVTGAPSYTSHALLYDLDASGSCSTRPVSAAPSGR